MKKSTLIITVVAILAIAGIVITLLLTRNNEPPEPVEPEYSVNVIWDEKYGSVTGGGKYKKGDKVELWAAGKDNEEFKSDVYAWYRDGKVVSINGEYAFDMSSVDVTITVDFGIVHDEVNYEKIIADNITNYDGNTSEGNLDWTRLFSGITLGQVLLSGEILPTSVTENEAYKITYDTPIDKLLANDADTVNHLRLNSNMGILADMIFAGARCKTDTLSQFIKSLYEMPIEDINNIDISSGGVIISEIGTMTFGDIFDSYVINSAYIDTYPVYEALAHVKIRDILLDSLSAENEEKIDELRLVDFLNFYFALTNKTEPEDDFYKKFKEGLGNAKVGDFKGPVDNIFDKIKEIINGIDDIKDMTITDFIESKIDVPAVIKNKDWYKKLSQKTIVAAINEIIDNIRKELPQA